MELAKINIEVSDEGCHIILDGPRALLMKALTDAIKQLEGNVPEELAQDFRIKILEMLYDMDINWERGNGEEKH